MQVCDTIKNKEGDKCCARRHILEKLFMIATNEQTAEKWILLHKCFGDHGCSDDYYLFIFTIEAHYNRHDFKSTAAALLYLYTYLAFSSRVKGVHRHKFPCTMKFFLSLPQ